MYRLAIYVISSVFCFSPDGRGGHYFGALLGGLRFVCLIAFLLSPLEAVFASSSANPNGGKASEGFSGKVLLEIRQQKSDIDALKDELAQKLAHTKGLTAIELGYVQSWGQLAERFVFAEQDGISAQKAKAEALIADGKVAEGQAQLEGVKVQQQSLLESLNEIEKSVEAEKKADRTQEDAKMYFFMRERQTRLPDKTQKAFGVMGLAKATRDKGEFTKALELWAQAEKMVGDSVNELIAEQAQWLKDAKVTAKKNRALIKERVLGLLEGYFVTIPEGDIDMGGDSANESPIHRVQIPSFKLAKTEVTYELWDLCVENTRCYNVPKDYGWGREDKPVGDVSYKDIVKRFIPWLNQLTGKSYRLPSEAEWEYAARAGSKKNFSWGDSVLCSMARYDGGRQSVCNATEPKNKGPLEVKSYAPNAFGLYDMHGNVWEWVEDCWNPNYEGAPTNGSAWVAGSCEKRVLRGGSWAYPKSSLRSSARHSATFKTRRPSYGFRLVLDEQGK